MDLQPRHLHNEWVILKPLVKEDFESLYQVACDPLIWEQHPNPDRYKRDVFANYFEGAMLSKGAMLILDNQKHIIGCSRFYDHIVEQDEIKIGYTFFSRNCWGKPFNRSTKQLMIDHAFQYVNNVIFNIGAKNFRSQKAIEKLGAVKIGEEEVAYFGEAPKINFIYRIRKMEWEKQTIEVLPNG